MKKLFVWITVLMLAVLSVSAAAAEEKDLLARIQEKGELVIATEGTWSPWTYHDENDALTGFDVEVGRLIAQGLGVQAVFMETDWSAILAGVDSGRFDIACNGVDYTEERAEKYDFTDPYVYNEMVLVVRADDEQIKDFPDLNGKTTANSPNSTYALRAEQEGASVVYVEALAETMILLQQGRVDATINAKGSVDEYLEEHPEAKIKIACAAPGLPVCFPLRKGEDSATLLAAINDILSQAREDGTLAALSEKYFGVDLTRPL